MVILTFFLQKRVIRLLPLRQSATFSAVYCYNVSTVHVLHVYINQTLIYYYPRKCYNYLIDLLLIYLIGIKIRYIIHPKLNYAPAAYNAIGLLQYRPRTKLKEIYLRIQ